MRPQANILLVDDRPENLLALEAILAPLGENLVRAESGEAALRAMLHNEFAVILLDVQMPGMDGYETAALIKSRERTRHVPIIFLTAIDTDDRAAHRGYGAGAVDYLFKPFDPMVLRSKVSVFIDLYHLKREAEGLVHRALHDPLTGLPNRVLFRDRLELALARTRRLSSSVGVLYLDLDNFKPVNDSLGHEQGDALLVELARRLRQVLRPADTVARLGGDEFAVLSDPIDGREGAQEIAERVLSAVAEPYELTGGHADISASIGVALTGGDSVDPESMLRAADQAMYAAKAGGGNQWSLHDPSAEATPIDLEAELVPRAHVVGGAPAGWGVTARARDGAPVRIDTLDRVSAERFVESALRAAEGAPVSVPIAPSLAMDLSGAVASALEQADAPPHTLSVEIAEGALSDPSPALLVALERVADQGVQLAVRGSGLSGAPMATLARLPFSALILDPSLDAAASRATVAVAHALGALAIVTGVDDDERLDAVRDLGCDVAQGAACGAATVES